MKLTLKLGLVFLTLASSTAFAAITTVTCRTDRALYDGKRHTVELPIENINGRRPELYLDEEAEVVELKVTPRRSPLQGLAENWSIKNTSSRLTIDGDSDGFYLVTLVLYKSQNLQRGFVRVDDLSEGFGDQYSTVTCTVR